MAREATNRILEMVEEGFFTSEQIMQCCLRFMSEDDVAIMATAEELCIWHEDE